MGDISVKTIYVVDTKMNEYQFSTEQEAILAAAILSSDIYLEKYKLNEVVACISSRFHCTPITGIPSISEEEEEQFDDTL